MRVSVRQFGQKGVEARATVFERQDILMAQDHIAALRFLKEDVIRLIGVHLVGL